VEHGRIWDDFVENSIPERIGKMLKIILEKLYLFFKNIFLKNNS